MEVAGTELDRLARIQAHQVEQQRRRHAGVAGVALGQAPTHAASGRLLAAAAETIGSMCTRPRYSAAERLGRPVLAEHRRQLAGAELTEQVERRVDRTDATERLELGQGAEQLRLRLGIRVAPGCEPRPRLLGRRVRLQRQWLGRREHLEQVRQRSGDVRQRSTVGQRGRAVRMGAEPQLGPRPAVGCGRRAAGG